MTDDHRDDVWEHGEPYELFVGRWSRLVAPEFVEWLDLPPGLRWLDVGCGTGALTAAILDRAAPSSVVGVEPSSDFLASAANALGDAVELRGGSADNLPLARASVDVTVSGLVLNFVPDAARALAEFARVTRRGGLVAAYVWDYGGRMDLIRHFWDAAVELDPAVEILDEALRFPVCNPLALEELFTAGGYRDVTVRAIDVPTPFADLDDYWTSFVGGHGPAPRYAMSLDEVGRTRLRDHIRGHLSVEDDGSIPLIARAWAVRASVV